MVAYVIEEVVAARESQPELICPHCKTQGKLEIILLRVQVTMAFIPMMGLIKGGWASCAHCGLPIRVDAEDGPIRQAYRAFRRRTRTPLRYQSGMIGLLLVLFLIFAQMFYQTHHNPWDQRPDPAILANPQVGDIYQVAITRIVHEAGADRVDTLGYTLARVEAVGEKVVTLRFRDNPAPGSSPPMLDDLLDRPGNYAGEPVLVKRGALRSKSLDIPGTTYRDEHRSLGSIFAARRP